MSQIFVEHWLCAVHATHALFVQSLPPHVDSSTHSTHWPLLSSAGFVSHTFGAHCVFVLHGLPLVGFVPSGLHVLLPPSAAGVQD